MEPRTTPFGRLVISTIDDPGTVKEVEVGEGGCGLGKATKGGDGRVDAAAGGHLESFINGKDDDLVEQHGGLGGEGGAVGGPGRGEGREVSIEDRALLGREGAVGDVDPHARGIGQGQGCEIAGERFVGGRRHGTKFVKDGLEVRRDFWAQSFDAGT